jgi:beta-phosphoglucomutase
MTERIGVIFDFDGVLADSEGLHLRAFQRTFDARGWTLTDDEYYATYLGWSDRDVALVFAKAHGLALSRQDLSALLAEKERAYAALVEAGDILYAGAAPAIRRLAECFPLAIASGSLSREIHDALRAAGLTAAGREGGPNLTAAGGERDLSRYFAAIVGADDVQEGKPAPDAYLEAARRLKLPPSHCVAVEDSPWGLESAGAAGARTIGITNTYSAPRLTGADVVISSLDELTPEFVRALFATGPSS